MTAEEARRIVRLAWETGRDYRYDAEDEQALQEAADDIMNAPTFAPPARTYEQRVADRMAEMEALGAPDPWPGGPTRRVRSAASKVDDGWELQPDPQGVMVLAEPVPWEGGPDRVPQWLKDAAERDRRHDAEVLRVAHETEPIDDWAQIHAGSTSAEWARIWRDLAPTTQERLADLAPRGGRVR